MKESQKKPERSEYTVLNDKENVLVVDDTPQNLDLLSEILSADGFNVRPAKSGGLALLSARTIVPDLILLDIMMPEMDGYEVCRRLKKDEHLRDVPVIFISALEDSVDRSRPLRSAGSILSPSRSMRMKCWPG